jgi:type VI secretion system secreted protein Hcp
MKARLFTSVFVVSVLAIQSQAALMAYLTIKGQKSGQFKGGITQKGREGTIGVIAADHIATVPSNSGIGRIQLIGKKTQTPFKLTLELDKATPLIYNAMVNGENLNEVIVDFWTNQAKAGLGSGVEYQHYSVKLTNATISEVHFNMANVRNSETAKYPETIEVSFNYQTIEWQWKDGGITAIGN